MLRYDSSQDSQDRVEDFSYEATTEAAVGLATFWNVYYPVVDALLETPCV